MNFYLTQRLLIENKIIIKRQKENFEKNTSSRYLYFSSRFRLLLNIK